MSLNREIELAVDVALSTLQKKLDKLSKSMAKEISKGVPGSKVKQESYTIDELGTDKGSNEIVAWAKLSVNGIVVDISYNNYDSEASISIWENNAYINGEEVQGKIPTIVKSINNLLSSLEENAETKGSMISERMKQFAGIPVTEGKLALKNVMQIGMDLNATHVNPNDQKIQGTMAHEWVFNDESTLDDFAAAMKKSYMNFKVLDRKKEYRVVVWF
jgi:hypothetical protein